MKLLKTLAVSSVLAMAPLSTHAALDTAGADWVATVADNYIDAGPASDSLSMVDFLLCIMENSNASNHVNETFGSMIDENKCNGVTATIPKFATQVMTTSRTDNTSPYTMKSWFVTADDMNVVVNASVTAAPTAAVPRGVVSLTWNMVDANGSGTGRPKGILNLNADNTLSYIEHGVNETTATILVSFVHGTLDGDGTSGRLRVQTQDWGTMVGQEPTDPVYQYVFNTDSAHYKTGSTTTCLDRRAANMTKRVYGYKLFDAAGALKSLTGPFDFRYTDPQDATEQRGWADKYGVWLQGNEDDTAGNARPTSITRNSNNKVYTVCWDDDDDGSGSCGTADDRIRYQMTHASDGVYTFEAPIKMVAANITDAITNAAVIPAVAWAREDSNWQFATYRGGVSHFDLPWQCMLDPTDDPTDDLSWTTEANNGNCNGKEKWRQKYALADGFEFTEQGTGTKYYAKAVDTKMTLAARADTAASCTNVSALALSTAPAALGAYTVPDITGDVIWGTGGAGVPSVANGGLTAALEMKVIHGVEQ